MTVTSQNSRIEQLGDGATTAFPVNFYFLASSDLKVYVSGILQSITTNYTVTGAGNPSGGSVNFVLPPASGAQVVIFRDPAITQGLDYIDNDPFPAESHERGLDRLTMIAQRIKDQVSRALKLGDSVVGVNTDLPAISGGKLLGTNMAGTAFQLYPLGSEPDVASNIVYTPSGAGAVETTVQEKLRQALDIRDFGAVGDGSDESAKAVAMIAAHNYLYIPQGFTLTAKNLQVQNNTKILCDGTLKLPSGCSDFDRLIYGAGKTGVEVRVKELDGNSSGQSGNIGTHLVYLANCPGANVSVDVVRNHYIASGAAMPSVDGIRNASSGAIFLYRCHKSETKVLLVNGWGREGIYLEECDDSSASLGHAQGTGSTEYSGIQVKGNRSHLLRGSVDNAGASGVGFDVINGTISNVLSTNSRENHGINFGHTGFPASGSVGNNLVVDGCFLDGIKVAAATVDLTLGNFAVSNAGRYGISCSDSSVRGSLSNGVVKNSGQANIQVSGTKIRANAVTYDELDDLSVIVTMATGVFVVGETVTTSGSETAVVRKVLKDLSNAEEILFLNTVSGPFVVSQTLTGATSGAVGVMSAINTPVQRLEQLGGAIIEDVRLYEGSQDQIRFPDGTAIVTAVVSVVIAAPATLTSVSIGYSSNVVWVTAPRLVSQVASVDSTGNYAISQLESSSSGTHINIDMIASVAQTYNISVIGVGRWK